MGLSSHSGLRFAAVRKHTPGPVIWADELSPAEWAVKQEEWKGHSLFVSDGAYQWRTY